jgi:trans-aconitate 2-methyltransferase
MPTWNAQQYLKFADQRSRPCRDLADRVEIDLPSRVIDLGCGPGNSSAVLAGRWPGAKITGLDSSSDMIAAAKKSHPAGRWTVGDIRGWASDSGESFDVVFSNAALQWVDDHAATYPRLMARVCPGGALAVQIPCNYDAPAHQAMRDLASAPAWRDRFPSGGVREWHVHDAPFYYDSLSPSAGRLDIWETEYLHIMPSAAEILEWYRGTGLRPFLEALASQEEREKFAAEYLELIRAAYPPRPDGRVIFPFRRLFIVAYK